MQNDDLQSCIILGCPRSGKFLLKSIIDQIFDADTHVETQNKQVIEKYIWLWGDLSIETNRTELVDAIFEFLDIWTPRMIVQGDLNEAWKFSLCSVKKYKTAIIEKSSDYPTVINSIFEKYAELNSKSIWVDKSAFYEPVNLSYLSTLLPNTKVIHIVRDGRDCALSWMKTWAKPSSLEEAAALWSKHVENNTNWVRSHNERALEIRYEDLITEPIDSIKLISKFLSKEPRTMNISLENSTYAQVLSNLSSHKLVSGPLKQNNKHKFSRQMNEIEIARFNYFASNQLELWQYPDLSVMARPPGTGLSTRLLQAY